MNKSILSLILLATPMAFGANSSATSTTNSASSPQVSQQFDSNSNDRFDNVDTRTNSKSTPASVGFENRQMQADITQEENQWATEETQVATSGSSTGAQSPTTAATSPTHSEDVVYETEQEQPRMSGSSTTPSASSETGRTTTSSTKSAPGAAIGTSAVGTKNKPSSTTDTRETSATTTSTTNETESGSSMSGSSAAAGGMAAGSAANKNATGGTGNDLTAQDTATSEQATETVRKIRASITDDKNLSMSAHNVKIINENNSIYLKGPVKSAAEKAKVEEIAKRMAGNTTVINQTYVEKR